MSRGAVAVIVLISTLVAVCNGGSVNSWGWGFGRLFGDGDSNRGSNNNGGSFKSQDRVAAASTNSESMILSIADPGVSVGRLRRQNSGGNINTCRVENNRVLGQWQCNNGQTIDCSGLCNGPKDCSDGSDETVLSCRLVFCHESAFRCSYGGCIRADLECNGVKDCADGSDEKTLSCPGVLANIRANGNCSEGFFQCKSGECIYDDSLCSGGAECPDGSDETAALCSTHFCPEPGFRCDYGACVLKSVRCDGIRDCIDGSDEKAELCASFRIATASEANRRPAPTLPLLRSSTTSSPPSAKGRPTNIDSVISEFRNLLLRQEMLISQLERT